MGDLLPPFYVYDLIDPRTDKPFYVGKGTGDRCHQHVKDAKAGYVGLKCDRIRQILADGLGVSVRIVRRFDCEDDAYAYEARRIARIGLKNLTNAAPGGREMRSEVVENRKLARAAAKSMSRMLRVLHKHKEVGFRFGGQWHDLPRDQAETICRKGISHVFDILGESSAIAEFKKYNVEIENRIQPNAI